MYILLTTISHAAKFILDIIEFKSAYSMIYKLRGDDIVKYVDKEITKYNNICEIPKEFIDAHNHAAESLK